METRWNKFGVRLAVPVSPHSHPIIPSGLHAPATPGERLIFANGLEASSFIRLPGAAELARMRHTFRVGFSPARSRGERDEKAHHGGIRARRAGVVHDRNRTGASHWQRDGVALHAKLDARR